MMYTKDIFRNPKNNNIFHWATKELSQDAIIAWILCGNKGKDFLNSLTSHPLLNTGNPLPKEFEIIAIYAQDNRAPSAKMDVFVEIKGSDGKFYAVIIEDKTDSWLHDQQILKYIYSACMTTQEKSSKKKYAGIYFIVVKTGSYYFWEHSQYIAEAQSIIQNSSLPEWLFVRDKASLSEKCVGIQKTTIPISFFYYLFDDYYAFIQELDNSSAWIKDYKEYLSDLRDAFPTKSWMTDLKNSFDGLMEKIRSQTDLHYKWMNIIRRPNGGGKKPYNIELWTGGNGVVNRDTRTSIEQRLCVLIYLELSESEEIKIGVNCHLFTDITDPAGYCSSNKLGLTSSEEQKYQSLRKRILELARKINETNPIDDRLKWKEYQKLRDLQLCTVKCSNANIFENNDVSRIIGALAKTIEAILDDVLNPRE